MINVVLYKINLKTVCITTVIQYRSQYCDVIRNKLMYFYLFSDIKCVITLFLIKIRERTSQEFHTRPRFVFLLIMKQY
jgi:hypothetical protein